MQPIARMLLVLVLIVFAVGFVLLQPSTPTIASNGELPEAASSVESETGVVTRAEVATRCVTASDGWSSLCLSSDNSGSLTIANGDMTTQYRYAFYDNAGNCPSAPAGYTVQLRDWAATDWLSWGLTPEDLAALTLGKFYCAYTQ